MDSRALIPRSAPTRAAVLLLALVGVAISPAAAQDPTDDDGVRIGVAFGGVATFGITLEVFRGKRSVDLTVGTWSFKDLSVAVAAKQYFGGGDVLPFVGGGLWLVAAAPSEEGEQTGFALVLHAPVGVDWQAADDHHVGLSVNVNRGLWVRRTDPTDDLPLNRRLIPLPGAYYRFTRR